MSIFNGYLMTSTAAPAYAKGGEYGALECVPEALIHPAIMGCLLIASLFAADAGWKYRFVREDTTTKEIKALEKENEVL
jgi:hypothetical protein